MTVGYENGSQNLSCSVNLFKSTDLYTVGSNPLTVEKYHRCLADGVS